MVFLEAFHMVFTKAPSGKLYRLLKWSVDQSLIEKKKKLMIIFFLLSNWYKMILLAMFINYDH